ncbi:MAG: DUF3391 domain-containing protein [Marinomonas sp.]
MKKTIAVSELELGMFVQKMCGSWFDHPFWAAKFLIDDRAKLRTLQSSKLNGVVIDTSKGKDTAEARANSTAKNGAKSAPMTVAQRSTRAKTILAGKLARPKTPQPTSTDKELRVAQGIADRGAERMHKTFLAARLGKTLNVRAVEPVVSDIFDSVRRNPQALGGLMRCKLKNELTYHHALAVSALMVSLGRQMKLPEKQIRDAGMAGLFLDIGINHLPQNLTPASGDFRDAEPHIWEQHVVLGYRALQNDDSLPQTVVDACLQHHERIDGKGFPNALPGDEIGLIGRMAAICDSFDFMLNASEASAALDPAAAIQALQQMDGAFDQEILRLFIESVGLYPVGSFVELNSGKLAMVIDEDPSDKTKPVVQAFYSCIDEERVIPHRIELAKSEDKDAIFGMADLREIDIADEASLRDLLFLGAHKFSGE